MMGACATRALCERLRPRGWALALVSTAPLAVCNAGW